MCWTLNSYVNRSTRKTVPGLIRDIHFKNVRMTGAFGPYLIRIDGPDAARDVQGVVLENVTVHRKTLTRQSPAVRIGACRQRPVCPGAGRIQILEVVE